MKGLEVVIVNLHTSDGELPCKSYIDPKVPGLSLNRPPGYGGGGKSVVQHCCTSAKEWTLTHQKSGLAIGPSVTCKLAKAVEFLREVGKLQNWNRPASKVSPKSGTKSRELNDAVLAIKKRLELD